jgi:ubiquinone biosynthesis protein
MTSVAEKTAPDVSAAAIDADRFAFSEDGPWRVDLLELGWLDDLDVVRAATKQTVPELCRRRWLPPLRRFAVAAWWVGGAVVLWALRERRQGGEASRAGLSRRLRVAFEKLGPAYIKLGQIVSSARGLFPDELVEEFKRCRDQVPAEDWIAVRRVIEAELGGPIEATFSEFDHVPLAAASIAQVHRARLKSGEEVVVKVQRPSVAHRVYADIAAMAWIAPWLVGRIPIAALANPPALVELFAETIVEELDFRLEAENMLDVAAVLHDAGQTIIVVPRPHPELVTRRLLVMERLEGFGYDDLESMKAAGIDTAELLHGLLVTFLEGAMIYGVFHGDLHGGNLFVMPDGRVALFDFGMTGRMGDKQRRAFMRMMMTGAANDVRGQLEAFRDLGAMPEDADLDALVAVLKIEEPVRDPTKMSGEELAAEIQDVLKGLLAQGARLPKHLMLYVKGMLFFDGAVAVLAPDLNMFAEMARIYGYFATHHADVIAAQIGFDPSQNQIDLSGARQAFGLEGDVDSITHRELQARRQVIQKKLEEEGALPTF